MADADTHFEGKPCPRCGGTLRYVSSRQCFTCCVTKRKSPEMRAYHKQRNQKIREELRKLRAAANKDH